MASDKPRCAKCELYHWAFTPCEKASPPPTIEWRESELLEWGDRVQGGVGGPVQDSGWGCKTILPAENPK